eukprot:CAMPEP_0114988568 /NCGR_PEP_ID=MMETSP0216-20121206/9678_1 /TAXON_ID=223996 /ORGANISM="Protocruzia adherens, Strain Boccale" /LENGTH=526 /DNA_ID=CAMNT_0002351377 /DNA_START=16 /DNA_END=1596 /DNA_ORIENTATION=+
MGNNCCQVREDKHDPSRAHTAGDDAAEMRSRAYEVQDVNGTFGRVGFKTHEFAIQNPKSFKSVYHIVKPIGEGSFGTVCLVQNLQTGEKRAAKLIHKGDQYINSDFFCEIATLNKLDNPHILKIFEYFEEEDKIYIVTDFCEGGELLEEINAFIKKKDQYYYSDAHVGIIMMQMLQAVQACHFTGIVHRDIKPENLMYKRKNDPLSLRLVDFGAGYFKKTKKLKGITGSYTYMAPEVIWGEPYDEKCDLWSVGIVYYILLAGRLPYNLKGVKNKKHFIRDAISSPSRIESMFEPKLFSNRCPEAVDLLKKLLNYQPSRRISAAEALRHPFITKSIEAYKDNKNMKPIKVDFYVDNFLEYSRMLCLQRMALAYIGNQLISEQEREVLDSAFRALDSDGDGFLSRDEIYLGIRNAKPGTDDSEIREQANSCFPALDVDKNKLVDYSEFITASVANKLKDKGNNELIEKTFNYIDKDGSGYITKDELMDIFSAGSEQSRQWEKVLEEADENKDGKIDISEFRNVLTGMV